MPLRKDLLNPIPGDNPSGANLRWDPIYDQIKEARRQDDTGPQGEWQRERKVSDWRVVADLASKAIAERSKDLQLAVWLTEAALIREKLAGLEQGLGLLRGLIEQFWDTFYPEIEDGDLEPRLVLLGWVGERLVERVRFTPVTAGGLGLFHYQQSRTIGTEEEAAQSEPKREAREAAIKEGKTTPEEFDKDAASTSTAQYEAWIATIDSCLESLAVLATLCDEKFGDDPPSFVPLRTAIEEVRQLENSILQKRPGRKPAEPEPEPEPEVELLQDPMVTETGAAAAAVAPARKKQAVGLEPENLDDVAERLHAVAKFLRAQNAYNPAPYLLLRGYRWGELRGHGDSPDFSVLVPPPTEIRQTIWRLARESSWGELLETGEAAMAEPYGRAWLDLQRHVVNAAEQCGYAHIAASIRTEVRALLEDLPRLPEWVFSDGTPVANAETLAWLKQLASPAPPQLPPAAIEFEEPAESSPTEPDTFALAVDAVKEGRANEAIQMLAAEISRQRSGRARFQRKLQLAQICVMAGYDALARPILEELAQSIDTHLLSEWESPEIVAQPLALLYKCIAKLGGDEALKQNLYARISRLDPVQALECGR